MLLSFDAPIGRTEALSDALLFIALWPSKRHFGKSVSAEVGNRRGLPCDTSETPCI
jgi:hypothetical protein